MDGGVVAREEIARRLLANPAAVVQPGV